MLIHLGTTLGQVSGLVLPGLETELELGLEPDCDVLAGDEPPVDDGAELPAALD